jgi:hypothetical protein
VVKVAGYCTGVASKAGLSQTVYIGKDITLRGGYTNTWTAPDIESNPSRLDAQGQGRVLYICPGVSATIEGLHLTGGTAAGLGGGELGGDAGGGIYGRDATVALSDSRLVDNQAQRGGGLYLLNSHVELNRNEVCGNVADWTGGGMYLLGGQATLNRNSFFGNAADWDGGGLYLKDCTATLQSNTFATNTAHQSGGGLYLRFGTGLIEDNQFSHNSADHNGGGLYLDRSSTVTITESVINSNHGCGDGGGMYCDDTEAWLGRSHVIANTADRDGGGLHLLASEAAVIINTFIGDNGAENGSAVAIIDSSADFLHTTIASNGAGSGIYVAQDSTASLTNTILTSHTVGIEVAPGSSANLEATLWGCRKHDHRVGFDGEGAIVTGTRNYWGCPAFLNPGARDYHIGPGSAGAGKGISAGVTDDIDGTSRPRMRPDLGADEIWQVGLPIVLGRRAGAPTW